MWSSAPSTSSPPSTKPLGELTRYSTRIEAAYRTDARTGYLHVLVLTYNININSSRAGTEFVKYKQPWCGGKWCGTGNVVNTIVQAGVHSSNSVSSSTGM